MNSSTRTDVNRRSIYDESGVSIDGLDLSDKDGSGYASPLKISHSRRISGGDLRIPQGSENAVDINVSEHVALSGKFGTPGAQCDQVITSKGGTRWVRARGTILTERTRRKAHIEVGNWADQSYALARAHVYKFEHDSGGPVFVTVGWAVPFTIRLRGDCRYLFWCSMRLKAYWILKFIVRLFLRIPKGVKGPGWL